MQPTSFVIGEEPGTVLDDRTAHRAAEAIVHRMRLLQMVEVVGPAVRVQAVIVVELVYAAMPCIVAALGHERNLAAGRAPEVRPRICRRYLEFLGAFNRDRHHWRWAG